MLMHLMLSQRTLRLSSVIFILFTLFCSSEVISTILSSSSLIHSSASDILLLIPSRVFLISVIVLFVCSFLNFSRSLLIDSCIFSVLFSRVFFFFFFDHLYYHHSEFFFRLFSYLLFADLDFCVSCLFLHLCSIYLPFHYFFFNFLCLRSPFPRFQGKLNSLLEEG